MTIAEMRREYCAGGLTEDEAGDDPFQLFQRWFSLAVKLNLPDANCMTLATVGDGGRPSARVVLLKGVDHGFTFFTNYTSRKGRELAANPQAALVFYWDELERQVRIEGRVERTNEADSDAYFASRPTGSKLGAWASEQSGILASRDVLEARLAELQAKYPDGNVPRPPHWGGFRLIPDTIEFWQGRPNRLHDRLRFSRTDSGWSRHRLGP